MELWQKDLVRHLQDEEFAEYYFSKRKKVHLDIISQLQENIIHLNEDLKESRLLYKESVERWENAEQANIKLTEKLKEAKKEIDGLKCNNIECHFKRYVLKSVWDAIHQTPACGINSILCAAAQEIDALRAINTKLERYETALKQYADPENWDESEFTDLDLDDLWVGNSSQGYAVAQEALQDK